MKRLGLRLGVELCGRLTSGPGRGGTRTVTRGKRVVLVPVPVPVPVPDDLRVALVVVVRRHLDRRRRLLQRLRGEIFLGVVEHLRGLVRLGGGLQRRAVERASPRRRGGRGGERRPESPLSPPDRRAHRESALREGGVRSRRARGPRRALRRARPRGSDVPPRARGRRRAVVDVVDDVSSERVLLDDERRASEGHGRVVDVLVDVDAERRGGGGAVVVVLVDVSIGTEPATVAVGQFRAIGALGALVVYLRVARIVGGEGDGRVVVVERRRDVARERIGCVARRVEHQHLGLGVTRGRGHDGAGRRVTARRAGARRAGARRAGARRAWARGATAVAGVPSEQALGSGERIRERVPRVRVARAAAAVQAERVQGRRGGTPPAARAGRGSGAAGHRRASTLRSRGMEAAGRGFLKTTDAPTSLA